MPPRLHQLAAAAGFGLLQVWGVGISHFVKQLMKPQPVPLGTTSSNDFGRNTDATSCGLGERISRGGRRLALLQVRGVRLDEEVNAVGKLAISAIGHALEHEAPAPLTESHSQK